MTDSNSSNGASSHLVWFIVLGIVLGTLLGGFWPDAGRQVQFIGELFIKALMMLVVPLIMTSMIVGITGLGDVRKLGGIGGKTLAYFLITTGIAAVIGLLLVTTVKPGEVGSAKERIDMRGGELLEKTRYRIDNKEVRIIGRRLKKSYDRAYVVELLDQPGAKGMIATPSKARAKSLTVAEWTGPDGSAVMPREKGVGLRIDLGAVQAAKGEEKTLQEVLMHILVGLIPENLFKSMAENDILPLIFFSLVFGAALTTLGERGKHVITFFEGANDAIMQIVHMLMAVAPVGIGALIAGRLGVAGGFENFWGELVRLSKYTGCVLVALAVHAVILFAILWLVAKPKVGPFKYLAGVVESLLTAMSTSSSAAALPVTMECVIEKNQISERTASFVVPLGATINMNGTALYEAIAAVFIAQLYGIELGTGQLVVVFITATLAAIGAAGIPEAGLVTMVIVLRAVDLPVEGISLILMIDWFLDRIRTTVNVWSDTVGTAVIERVT